MQKTFNPLIDKPPEWVTVNERDYRIASDFRVSLAYIRILDDDEMDEQEKIVMGLEMYFGQAINPSDISDLAKAVRWFLLRGKEPQSERAAEEPLFDIQQDAGRIYSAFLQAYRINLRKVKMHWWIFCELLEGLPKGTHLADVIEIRGRKIETWMNAADRNSLVQIKEHYKLRQKKEIDIIAGVFEYLRGIAQ